MTKLNCKYVPGATAPKAPLLNPAALKPFVYRNLIEADTDIYAIMANTSGLGTYLFVKVTRPGDSERPFRSSSQATTCYHQSNLLLPIHIDFHAFFSCYYKLKMIICLLFF